jgi:hypothetical protein
VPPEVKQRKAAAGAPTTPEEHEAEGKEEKAAAKGEAVRSKPLLAERLPLVEAP